MSDICDSWFISNFRLVWGEKETLKLFLVPWRLFFFVTYLYLVCLFCNVRMWSTLRLIKIKCNLVPYAMVVPNHYSYSMVHVPWTENCILLQDAAPTPTPSDLCRVPARRAFLNRNNTMTTVFGCKRMGYSMGTTRKMEKKNLIRITCSTNPLIFN